MKKKIIKAILDEELINFLNSINVYGDILEGKVLCCNCKKPVNEKNIMLILPKGDNKYEFVCDNLTCYNLFIEGNESDTHS